jgi:hypothetical protein
MVLPQMNGASGCGGALPGSDNEAFPSLLRRQIGRSAAPAATKYARETGQQPDRLTIDQRPRAKTAKERTLCCLLF